MEDSRRTAVAAAGKSAGPNVKDAAPRKRVVAELLVQRDGERLRLQVRAPEVVKRFAKVLTPTRSAGEWAGYMLVTPESKAQASAILKAAGGA